jgi:hypothetical protein
MKTKLKIIIGVGVLGLVLAVTLTVVVALAGIKYVASLKPDVAIAKQAEALKKQVGELPTSVSPGCLGAASKLLNLELLLGSPLEKQIASIVSACLSTPTQEPSVPKEGETI